MSTTPNAIGQALLAIAELINKPEHWTTGFAARDADGVPCNPLSPEATCWCLIGACHKVTVDTDLLGYDVADELRRHLERHNYAQEVSEFNDGNPHEQVLAVVLQAAEAAS